MKKIIEMSPHPFLGVVFGVVGLVEVIWRDVVGVFVVVFGVSFLEHINGVLSWNT